MNPTQIRGEKTKGGARNGNIGEGASISVTRVFYPTRRIGEFAGAWHEREKIGLKNCGIKVTNGEDLAATSCLQSGTNGSGVNAEERTAQVENKP